MMNRIGFLLSVIGFALALASCSTMETSESGALILTFVDFKDTYPQGIMNVVVQIENSSNRTIVLKDWIVMENGPNNIDLFSRPRGIGKFTDANPSNRVYIVDANRCNSVYFGDFVVLPKAKLQIRSSFVCNLESGDYEFQAEIISNPEVKTEWRKCRITPGEIIDTRK